MMKKTLLALSVAVITGSAFAEYNKSLELGQYRSADSAYQLRASDIIGRDVVNGSDDEIGEVDDLVIGSGENGIQAVLSVGGFLGIGDKLVTVPYSELRLGKDDDNVYYNSTEDQLLALPEFNYNEGENFGRDVFGPRLTDGTEHSMTSGINWDVIEGNWEQFKGKAQAQWGELTNDDWDIIEGNRTEMVGIIQERTGRAQVEIESEINQLTM